MSFWTEMLGGCIECVEGDRYRTRCLHTGTGNADHVEDFVHALGHDSAHIHGESLGGWIAGRIGIDRPELAESIGLNTTIGIGASIQDRISGDIRERQDEEMQDLYDRTTSMFGTEALDADPAAFLDTVLAERDQGGGRVFDAPPVDADQRRPIDELF